MLDGMSDSIQGSRIENLHSREVDRQSPTGLILFHCLFWLGCPYQFRWYDWKDLSLKWPLTVLMEMLHRIHSLIHSFVDNESVWWQICWLSTYS